MRGLFCFDGPMYRDKMVYIVTQHNVAFPKFDSNVLKNDRSDSWET